MNRLTRRLAVAGFLVATLSLSAAAQTARLRVDAAKVEARIDPLIYGQFVEYMFEGIKGGLHAELIRDRGFDAEPSSIGVPRTWDREPDMRNDDYALKFEWDDEVFLAPTVPPGRDERHHSLRVEVRENPHLRRGVYQSRIPVRAGVTYRGSLWAKSGGYDGRVAVSLAEDTPGGAVYATADLAQVAGDWRRYEFTLDPTRSDPLARLAILFYGVGHVWIDQVSLVPGDAVDGVRADVLERIKAVRPAFMRWPGGNVAQDYRWMWGVGPRDRRTTWVNLAWQNEPEPSDFGTDEYIGFCRNVGAEPTITVNVEGRGATAAEAAAWVEYCNGPATSKYGAMRAANGHPEPYGVKYWEIGNEIWGSWVRGHSDAATYGRNYNRYYEAMRAVDPTIKFIGCGDNDMRWNRTVLSIAGKNMDYFAIHHYYGPAEMAGDPLNLMARPLFYERFYREVRRLVDEIVPGSRIRLAINEWNTTMMPPRQHSMESALYAARLMNVFERSSELVAMTAVSDLVNGWPGGIIQASRHRVFVTPTYHVNRLYATHVGAERLASSVEGPTFDTSKEGRGVPVLDAVASRSADGRRVYLKLVNTDRARPLAVAVAVEVAGAHVADAGTMEVLTAESFEAANSFETPDAVAVRSVAVRAGRSFTVEMPAHSVAVVTLEIEGTR